MRAAIPVAIANRLSRAAGFGKSDGSASGQAVALTAIAFLPILLLSALTGTVVATPAIPLALDLAALVRLLLVLPLLVAAAPRFDAILENALAYPTSAGLVPAELRSDHEASANRFLKRRDGTIPVLIFATLAAASAALPLAPTSPLQNVSSWAYSPEGGRSPAGIWYFAVALPLLRFAILLWLWRFGLWTLFLARLTRIELSLVASHPDGAGGLAFLGFVQQRLSLLLIAGSLMLFGSAANRVLHGGSTFNDLLYPLLTYTLVYPLLLILPLLLMAPSLMRVKRSGVFAYSAVGQRMAAEFDTVRTGRENGQDDHLSSPSHSAMADFGTVHQTVANMRVIPLSGWQFASMIISACAPFSLLIFLLVPFDLLIHSALSEIPPLDLVANASPTSKP